MLFLLYACGKRYYVCVTCMQWCSNTETVPLLVSNIHDIVLVHTQYVLVCTSLYYFTFPVQVCTWYVQVHTSSKLVHTKYPVPVMLLTIPDASSIWNPYKYYTWYIPCIYHLHTMYIPCIYHVPVYTWYVHGIYMVYTKDIEIQFS